MLAPLPDWIIATPAETLEAATFKSGAALAHLTLASADDPVPQALWRDRQALAAAEVSARISGRREGAAVMRDALLLTKPGDDPGPAGSILRQWSRAVSRPISVTNLGRALEGIAPERIALSLDANGPTPVDRAAQVLEAVLTDNPRDETLALILADAVLSQALGRDHLLPLLGPVMTARDLRQRGDDLRLACHRSAAKGVGQALPWRTRWRGRQHGCAVRCRSCGPKGPCGRWK